jgi:hypothetical protein
MSELAVALAEYADHYNPRRPAHVARALWRGCGQAMLIAAAVGTLLLYEYRIPDESE